MCCVAPLRFSFSVSLTCRCSVRALFRAPFCLFRESPHSFVCALPLAEFGGLRQLPLPETSRRLTRLFHTWFGYWPNPTCRSVGKMCTSRVLVLYTHPFSILLPPPVILPQLRQQRNGVRVLERSILKRYHKHNKDLTKEHPLYSYTATD